MPLNLRRAITAGVVGYILVVAVVAFAGRLSGSDADLCALAGALVTGRDDSVAWLTGCAVQLLVAVVAALAYAAIFEWITRRAGALIGLAIAVPHAVAAGLAVGFLPAAPLIGLGITPPGAFLEYRGGWVVAAFVLAHLMFGTIAGVLYGPVRHVAPAGEAIWRDVTHTGS